MADRPTVIPLSEPPDAEAELAKKLNNRIKKFPVDTDSEGGANDDVRDLNGVVPGASAIRGIRHVTPFLFFLQSYAEALYPEIKNPARRILKLRERHRWVIAICGVMDFALQLILILAVLAGPAVIIYNGVKAALGL
ncbi:hypothetical protein SAMN04487916_12220 [Arthrobacter sp. ov407]|uniref:hypothetical protein n=1 Tax=Arthrobacter sp. ov407 TaxID=1761748 RepID=UPI0008901809|nr:hypothetical protein [Arthrobacter sp. ov407]SDM02733.1 hypothetical protein SAMN04487916_12220 [Arthrobacter sp. ov407]